jgi:hypothetical protein
MDAVLQEVLTMSKGEELFLPEDKFQPFTVPKSEIKPQVTAH